MTYVDERGCEYESYKEYIWCGLFNFCGCCDEELVEKVFETLKQLYDAKLNNNSFYYDGTILKELILHIFDSHNLVEHGTAIRGCWLTDDGFKIAKKCFDNKKES